MSARVHVDTDVNINDFYVDWDEEQEFVDFVLEQIDAVTPSFALFSGREDSLGGKTEAQLLKALKDRKKDRKKERKNV